MTIAKSLWGVFYGLGFGAGMSLAFHISQKKTRTMLAEFSGKSDCDVPRAPAINESVERRWCPSGKTCRALPDYVHDLDSSIASPANAANAPQPRPASTWRVDSR